MSPNRNSKIVLLIIAVLFCYDYSTYLSDSIPVALLKGGSLAVVVLLYFVYILRNGWITKFSNHNCTWRFLLLFLAMVTMRVFYDFVIQEIHFFIYNSPVTVVFMFTCIFLLPTFFFYKYQVSFSIKNLAFLIGSVLFTCLFLSAKSILLGNGVTSGTSGRFDANESIDVIYYGHMGASLFIIGIFFLVFQKRLTISFLGIIFLIVGSLSVAFSGERGPFVALIICSILLLYIRFFKAKFFVMYVFLLLLLIVTIPFLINQFNDYLLSMDISSLLKIVEFINNEGDATSTRTTIYLQGIDYFLENPIIGYSYLLPDGSYLHNIFLEQFMALGIIGGLVFIWLNLLAINHSYKLTKIKKEYAILFALFVQYLLFGCFSRTLITIPQYWLMLVVILSVYDYEKGQINLNCHTDL